MSIEYYVTRVNDTTNLFKVTKFDGGSEPENVYFVKMLRKGERGWNNAYTDPQMHCDCPNARRHKHINDKHGQMVSKWLLAGEKNGYFTQEHEFVELEPYIDDEELLNDAGEQGADDEDPDDEDQDE